MPYVYDAVTKQARLIGAADSWSRLKLALPAPAGGETQMLVMLRFWIPTLALGTTLESGFQHGKEALYFGLSFTGNQLETNHDNEAEWANFCGVVQRVTGSIAQNNAGLFRHDTPDAVRQNFAHLKANSYLTNDHDAVLYSDGAAQKTLLNNETDPDPDLYPMAIPVGEAFGQTATLVMRFARSDTDNSVDLHAWWNFDSVDLDNLDVLENAQLDPNNPLAVFPVGQDDSSQNLELFQQVHANSFGDNWVTTDGGDTNWPGYLIMRNPFQNVDIILQNCLVQYGTPTP